MGELKEVLQTAALEWDLNKGLKLKLLVLLFRLAALKRHSSIAVRLCAIPVSVIYKFYSQVLVGLDLDPRTRIGAGLKIFHGYGLVVHPDAVIGKNCTLRQGVTIGNRGLDAMRNVCPKVGDGVEFGAGAVVVGSIRVGNNSVIGANVLVTRDVPDDSIVVPSDCVVKQRRART